MIFIFRLLGGGGEWGVLSWLGLILIMIIPDWRPSPDLMPDIAHHSQDNKIIITDSCDDDRLLCLLGTTLLLLKMNQCLVIYRQNLGWWVVICRQTPIQTDP